MKPACLGGGLAKGAEWNEVLRTEVDNLIINCRNAAFAFRLIWSAEPKFPLYGCNVRRNIMVQKTPWTNPEAKTRIGPFYEPPWHNDSLLNQPMTDDNIFFVADDGEAGEEALPKAQTLGLDRNSVAADPMFVDMEHGDFRFKDGSPALQLGITPITTYGIQEPCGLTAEYGCVGN